jgi:S-adenosylmethionine synthetase
MGRSGFGHVLTSESVTEGHPDKVCDFIADTVLDTCLEKHKDSHVACEVLCKGGDVVVAGEITLGQDGAKASAPFDRDEVQALVRDAVREVGYVDPAEPFCDTTLKVNVLLTQQAGEIAQGVNRSDVKDQGAGDQGIMFGYATDETPELMPLPILLAHRLAHQMSIDRKERRQPWLRPDGKTQVSVEYADGVPQRVTTVLVSTQHTSEVTAAQHVIREYVAGSLAPRGLGAWFGPHVEILVNPTGSFEHGGPSVDCGVTGRKIIVDTYGGAARHGGGAFSGKDPSKVDRSGAYFCRYVARQVVKQGLAHRAEIQVAYAIGKAEPLSVKVDTFGTGDPEAAAEYVRGFDFRPGAIIERLDLKRPIYRRTTNYGHFGRPDLPWEA